MSNSRTIAQKIVNRLFFSLSAGRYADRLVLMQGGKTIGAIYAQEAAQKVTEILASLAADIADPAELSKHELDLREGQHAEVERQRILKVLQGQITNFDLVKQLICAPAEPEKLPAGWYAIRNTVTDEEYCNTKHDAFTPCKHKEYRLIPNPFKQAEKVEEKVTEEVKTVAVESSNPEKLTINTAETDMQKPTLEEWCIKNVPGWDDFWSTWYRASSHHDVKCRVLPDAIFDALQGGDKQIYGACRYASPMAARSALKATLLMLGKIRYM